MFWVIDVVGDAPFCWKSEVYTSDKSDYLSSLNSTIEGDFDGDYLYVQKVFHTMEEVEEYCEGYYYLMGDN